MNRIEEIADDMINNYIKAFSESLNVLESYLPVVDNLQTQETKGACLKEPFNKIGESVVQAVDQANKKLDSLSEMRDKKKLEVNQLLKELEEKKMKCTKSKNLIKKSEHETTTYEKKLQDLQNSEDCVKAYKVLTQAHLVYGNDNTIGYIKNGSKVEVFNFEKSANPEEVTEKLWDLMENTV